MPEPHALGAASPPDALAGIVPMPPGAVERYFETSLYLLLLTGFGTLASTGKLDAISLLFLFSALLFRGWLLLHRQTFLIPERWTTLLTLGYAAFYLFDFFFLSGYFVNATVHLVLFAMVVKIFSVQRDRDYLYLALLAFAMVLATAVLTVDSIFLGMFCIFVLLAVNTFVSMEMRRSLRDARRGSSASSALSDDSVRAASRFGRSLSGASLALVAGIVIAAALLFFAMPRVSGGYMSMFAQRNELATGFSQQVNLGEIGRIQQTDTVVMHVQVYGGADPAMLKDLKWRGVALENFDGKQWSNAAGMLAVKEPAGVDKRFYLAESQNRIRALPAPEALRPSDWRRINYRVIMDPIDVNLFFLAPVAEVLEGDYRAVIVDRAGTVFNADRRHPVSTYRAQSLILKEDTELPLADPASDPDLDRRPSRIEYWRSQYPFTAALTAKVTAGLSDDYRKARAIEDHLQANYGYTLELPTTVPANPVENFLFERKRGHCEYFASAMAVMLRTIGIRSRVVNGFRNGEYNDLTGSFIIRGRQAHSWVEAYLPGRGWMSFDPTPADPMPSRDTWSRMALYLDALREFWREWVVNYDFSHQSTLARNFEMQRRKVFNDSRSWMQHAHDALLDRARRWQRSFAEKPRRYAILAALLLALILLLFNLPRLWRLVRDRRIARNPERAPALAASVLYRRMTHVLARRGWPKSPSQTPVEFTQAISDPHLRQPVIDFTEHYERARFGDSAKDARRLPGLLEQIEDLQPR